MFLGEGVLFDEFRGEMEGAREEREIKLGEEAGDFSDGFITDVEDKFEVGFGE